MERFLHMNKTGENIIILKNGFTDIPCMVKLAALVSDPTLFSAVQVYVPRFEN